MYTSDHYNNYIGIGMARTILTGEVSNRSESDNTNQSKQAIMEWLRSIHDMHIRSSRYSTNTSRTFAVQKQLFMPNVSVTDL